MSNSNAEHRERLRACVFPQSPEPIACPLCGEVYAPQIQQHFTCQPCYERLHAEGLTFAERLDRVLTAKIKRLLVNEQ